MRLRITDYSRTRIFQSAIWELWVNINHVSSTNVYKIYKSETVDLVKIAVLQPAVPTPPPASQGGGKVVVGIRCQKCGTEHRVQVNFDRAQPLEPGAQAFPKDCLLKCSQCGDVLNLTGIKLQVEAQTRRRIVL